MLSRWLQQIWRLLLLFLLLGGLPAIAADDPYAFIDQQISAHQDLSGVVVLEKGEDALLARAWLTDHAKQSIDVQYFIWSTDNIGILAAEALLRAAERGVQVRVIVDDLLIDAPDKSLLALALHPNVSIRIYNPKHSVGTPIHKRLLNVVTDFRGVNQRMHDKTFIVDGKAAITGGRNMADEYFDYDHEYNFRDRELLLLGPVVDDMGASFERFWSSELSVGVEQRFDGLGLFKTNLTVDDGEIQQIYRQLHDYARSPDNFKPEVRAAIEAVPMAFQSLADKITWTMADFISDTPGKNSNQFMLGGGGLTAKALAGMVGSAREQIVIQSPYLVLSSKAEGLFRAAVERGVRIRISTNSLASTDNLQAFSGYANQRQRLLDMGLEIHEYKPYPQVQHELFQRFGAGGRKRPVFALHAKTMVIDSETVYVGTYNLDPRSENLNTEVGVVVRDVSLAKRVEHAIDIDMHPDNSWNAATDEADSHASLTKRLRLNFWQLAPIKPLL